MTDRTQAPRKAAEPPRSSRVSRVYVHTRRRVERAIGHVFFEWQFGVETAKPVRLRALGLDAKDRIDSVPSDWLVVRRALRALSVRPDERVPRLRCRKGQRMLMAARHPFKRVIGVELSEELKAIADRNLEKNRRRFRCGSVELVRADAVTYEVPDDVTVVYFYAPFSGEIFARVMDNLIASIDRHPRQVRLIYNRPWDERTLMFTGRARQIRRWSLGPTGIYVLEPRRTG